MKQHPRQQNSGAGIKNIFGVLFLMVMVAGSIPLEGASANQVVEMDVCLFLEHDMETGQGVAVATSSIFPRCISAIIS